MELSTYFRINARNTGQFERTLIVADDDSYVSYLEGCTAPMRDENQLHAAIVEIIVHDRAEVKYSTVQNWYPGDAEGKGGVYNFVTKRGNCKGVDSKLSWTQVETGSAITWKYPSCILTGDNSTAEFYSVAVTNNYQQADTGTKMIHLGKNTRSTIVSKGISAGHSENSYVGWYVWPRKRIMPVIIASVTLCCWEINVVRILSLIWIFTMKRQWWNMKPQRARSVKTRYSIATSAVFRQKMRSDLL